MKPTFGPPPGVIQSYIDSMSGMIKRFGEDSVQSHLQARYHQNMQDLMSRYSQMPDLLLWNQGGNFIELLLEARTDYVQGYYWSTVAVCGMVVESLCRDISKFRTDDAEFARAIGDKYIREAINSLKDNGFFWLKPTPRLMHEIMNVRNDYVHVKKDKIDKADVLDILVKTNLVVIAEFGMMPGRTGSVVRVNQTFFDKRAASLGIKISDYW